MKGNKYSVGTKHSVKFKKKQRQRMLGHKINLGRKIPLDYRKRISFQFKNLWANPNWKRKTIKAQNLGKVKSLKNKFRDK